MDKMDKMDKMISMLVFRTLEGQSVVLPDIDINRQFGSIKKDLENRLNYPVKLILCENENIEFDGVEQKEGTVYTNEFMCINLENVDSDGNYTEIPIIECLTDNSKKLINTFYIDQEIIELNVLNNKFVLEFPDKKFVLVE